MQIGIASRRVGSHYLASFRLAKEEKKRRGRGRKREKERPGSVPGAAIDLPPRNFIVHR